MNENTCSSPVASNHPTSRSVLWIVNHYSDAPHKNGGRGRHFSLATKLNELGWDTSIIAASTNHPTGTQAFPGFRPRRYRSENGVAFSWVWSNSYTAGIKRAIGMFIFAVGVLIPGSTKSLPTPDVVMGCTVHPLAAWAGERLARRHRAVFAYEIRDLWPETLVDLGALDERSIATRLLRRLSLKLARRARLVISPLPGVGDYLKANNVDTPFLWIPNGIDESLVVDSPAVQEMGPPDPFTFMYLGSHGRANALATLIRAFDAACKSAPTSNLSFRLVGDGPEKQNLIKLAQSLPHGNKIDFEDAIPRSDVNSRAREADCLVVNLLDSPVYKYGISLNKLYDYLLAARPVIIASNALNDPIAEAHAGLSVSADNVAEIGDAMIAMRQADSNTRDEWGRNGRAQVLASYTYGALARRLARGLNRMIAP